MKMKTQILSTIAVCGLLSFSRIAQAQVSGAGATFPELLYNNWAKEFKASGGAAINYQGIGSGGGIKAITARTVDFGASDSPMSAAELQGAAGIVHIPMCVGGVVPAFNVPGVAELKLTGPVIADIYLHKITLWNDAAIAGLNPGVKLPATRIITVSRADGSGTTAIFTNYLSKISPTFESSVGEGKAVNWPKPGIAGKGNPGVAALIKQTPGAFGYIEQAFADKNRISYASVKNAKGMFIKASLKSVTEAATSAKLPSDFRAMITNTNDADGYPIAGFTWILVYPNAKPEVKKFLQWCLTSGQKSATKYDYAPLPAAVQQRALAALAKIGG
jgi:phosphate transport system substrate-binding protein